MTEPMVKRRVSACFNMSDRLRVILNSAPASVSLTQMKEVGDLYWKHSSYVRTGELE